VVGALAEHVEHFRSRVLSDALNEATAAYWRRRAEMLRWAQPKPGEYAGRASTEELRARWQRLEEEARACENRARVALLGGDEW
jgi:hypothetical protein